MKVFGGGKFPLSRIRHIFLCLSLLLLALLATQLVQGHGDSNYTRNETQVNVYLVKILVKTSSDWTAVNASGGPVLVSCNVAVVEGLDAPDLSYHSECSNNGFSVGLGKKQFDQTSVTIELLAIALMGSDMGSLEITKGHIGGTVVEIYVIRDGQYISCASFMHEGVNWDDPVRNPRVFNVDYVGMYKVASGKGILEGKPESLTRRIFAFYYPWYGNPVGPSSKWFHWGPDIGKPVRRNELPTSVHYPLLGIYDSHDPNVIAAHIAMAQYAGIDGFIASWWGIGTLEDGTPWFEDRAFQILLEVAEDMNFTVTIYYESFDPRRRLTEVDEVIRELKYVVTKYGSSPAFMKVNGRPVIFLYAVEEHKRDASFWLEARQKLEREAGPVYLIGDTHNPSFRDVFDGFHRYGSANPADMDGIYDTYRSTFEVGLKALECEDAVKKISSGEVISVQEKLRCFTVTPGYNLTKVGRPELVLDRRNALTYREYWETAIELEADSILITSWNEWHEGTEIEPSREHGFVYPELTRRFAELYKQVTIRYPGSPQISVKRGLSEDGSTITISVLNRGMGTVVAVTSTMKLTGNARYVGSTRYTLPLDGSDELAIIVPYIGPGSTATITVTITPIALMVELQTLTVTAYSPWGDAQRFEVDVQRYCSMDVSSTSPVELLINGIPTNIATTRYVCWVQEGTNISFEAKPEIHLEKNVRLKFIRWSGDVEDTSPKTNVIITKPLSIIAEWKRQFYVNVTSNYGTVRGSGWYDEGSFAIISISTTRVVSPYLFHMVFDGWTGDIADISPTTTIRVEKPITLIAQWKIDVFEVILAAVASTMVVATAYLALIRRHRSKKL